MDTSALLDQSYEDYLSDEPGAYGIPDGLTRDAYAALQRAARDRQAFDIDEDRFGPQD